MKTVNYVQEEKQKEDRRRGKGIIAHLREEVKNGVKGAVETLEKIRNTRKVYRNLASIKDSAQNGDPTALEQLENARNVNAALSRKYRKEIKKGVQNGDPTALKRHCRSKAQNTLRNREYRKRKEAMKSPRLVFTIDNPNTNIANSQLNDSQLVCGIVDKGHLKKRSLKMQKKATYR